jgi:hypothetical protein
MRMSGMRAYVDARTHTNLLPEELRYPDTG